MGYSIRLRLGDHVWNIEDHDGGIASPAVLAGLSFSWAAPQDRGWPPPRHLLPFDVLSGSVKADTAEEVADIAKNQVCHFTFTPDGFAEPLVEFAGRLGDPSIRPRIPNGKHSGVYLTFTASDYLVDLTQRSFINGGSSLIWETDLRLSYYLDAILAIMGYPSPFDSNAERDTFGFGATDNTIEGSYTDLAVMQMFGMTPVAQYDANGDLDPAQPWRWPFPDPTDLTPETKAYGQHPRVARPYELGLVGGVLTVADGGIDAALVPTGSLVWSRDREPNWVEYGGEFAGSEWRGHGQGENSLVYDDPASRRVLRLSNYADFNAVSIAWDVEEAEPWGPEKFVVLGYQDPEAVDGWLRWPTREATVVNLFGVDPQQNPAGEAWVSGMLGSGRFVIPADGKWYVEGLIRRSRPSSEVRDYAGAITFDDIGTLFPAVTFDQVDPGLTFNDLDLIGG